MAQYHVACGIAGILAGTLNKNETEWRRKCYVTDEACSAVAQWLLQENKSMRFHYKNDLYTLSVTKGE